jgi:hypothetical protein
MARRYKLCSNLQIADPALNFALSKAAAFSREEHAARAWSFWPSVVSKMPNPHST